MTQIFDSADQINNLFFDWVCLEEFLLEEGRACSVVAQIDALQLQKGTDEMEMGVFVLEELQLSLEERNCMRSKFVESNLVVGEIDSLTWISWRVNHKISLYFFCEF